MYKYNKGADNMNRENEIINVRVDEIIPNRFQPRLSFNEAELKELAESIKMHGIIQPLVLRRIGDKFEIIAGERRHKAAMLAGLQTVPAVIMNMDDKQSAEVAVVENLQRKNLTAIEEAQSYKKILDMGYLTQDELAVRMGVTQPTIANKLRLLNLTEPVKQALLNNQISERHARSLLAITDPNTQIAMLNRIITERLTEEFGISYYAAFPGCAHTINVAPSSTTPPVIPNTVTPPPVHLNEDTPTKNVSNTPFDVDIEKIKSTSEDIIKEHVPTDIDMLLRKESDTPQETNGIVGGIKNLFSNKVESLEDEEANIDMGSIAKQTPMSINPFMEEEPEVVNLEIPTSNVAPTPQENYTEPNSIIEEFRRTTAPNPAPVEPERKNINSVISSTRDEVNKIKSLGFDVDTEEFDFEDMYQIIIKIKKD